MIRKCALSLLATLAICGARLFAGDWFQDFQQQQEIDSLRQDIRNAQAQSEYDAMEIKHKLEEQQRQNEIARQQAQQEAQQRQIQQSIMNTWSAPALVPDNAAQWREDMLDAQERRADAAEDQAFVLWSQQLARQRQAAQRAAEETRQAEAQVRAWDIERREEKIREAKEQLAKLDKALDDPQMSESGRVLIRLHRDRVERDAKLQPVRQREDFQEFAKYLDAGQQYYQRADGAIMPEIKPGKYVLQVGDTMTDISIRRFGTPDRWREIYERNKKLCDTNWHPGATLIIP